MRSRTTDTRLNALLALIHRCEDILLSILLVLTLGVAFSQIILRNVLGSSILWADILVRILVLWLGMLGAMVATRDKKHINIDLISRYLSPQWLLVVDSVVSVFAAGVCAIAGYFSLLFVIAEYQSGDTAFAQVPVWLCTTILPVVFGLIALRYLIQGAAAIPRASRRVRS